MTRKAFVKKKAQEFASSGEFSPTLTECFIAGAEWEHKRLVDKACEWLYDNFYEHPHEKNFICSENFSTIEDMIAWFQIIMEE
jgi:hypothetical protein